MGGIGDILGSGRRGGAIGGSAVGGEPAGPHSAAGGIAPFGNQPPPPPPPSKAKTYLNGDTRSPVTDALVRARYGQTIKTNFITIPGVAGSDGVGWTSYDVDRPTILIARRQLTGILRYAPINMPTAIFGGDVDGMALPSKGRGVVYLWAPGRWWLKYVSETTGDQAEMIAIPCEDPTVASLWLSVGGFAAEQKAATWAGSSHATGVGPAGVINIAANSSRIAIIIQNNSTAAGAPVIQVGLGGAPTTVNPEDDTCTGIRLEKRGTLTLAGDSLYRGAIVIKSPTALAFAVDWWQLNG